MAISTDQAIIGLDFLPIDKVQEAINRADGTFVQDISDDARAEEEAGGYTGNWAELSFSIGSAPGVANSGVLTVIRKVLQNQNVRYYEIDVLEDRTNWWQVPLWGNYQVKIYMHGSDPATLVIVSIIAAVLAVIAIVWAVDTWQVRLMKQETTTQLKVASDAQTKGLEVINSVQDPVLKQQMLDKWLQQQLDVVNAASSAANKPPAGPDTFAQIKTIAIVSVVGLGVIALLNSGLLSSAAKAIPQRA